MSGDANRVWQMASAVYGEEKLDYLLGEGWEPFAVLSRDDDPPLILLRRQGEHV